MATFEDIETSSDSDDEEANMALMARKKIREQHKEETHNVPVKHELQVMVVVQRTCVCCRVLESTLLRRCEEESVKRETDTFHLPIGEVTITLDDVSCLLHIPITGEMLNHLGTSCTTEEGAHIGFPMMEKIYAANLRKALKAEKDEESEEVVLGYRECTIRAFLLYLIGGTILTNKSMQYVDVIFLSYLQDLRLVNTWNWGASGLSYLYHYLEKATHPRCGNHGGYNCMFQAWIYEHFKRFGGGWVSEKYSHQNPICAKYLPLKGYKYSDEHMTTLDRMEGDEVTFRPYEDHRHICPFEDICWYSGWIMCESAMICPYMPECVLRQFGHVQSIPIHPDDLQKLVLIGNPARPANMEVIIEEDNADDKQDTHSVLNFHNFVLKSRIVLPHFAKTRGFDSQMFLDAFIGQEEKVYRLKKALYGLKQAPRAWYSEIDSYFIQQGFQKSQSEPTLYVKHQGKDDILLVAVYVDDLVYPSNNKKMVENFKIEMMKKYEMNDLGLLHHFLGIEVYQDEYGVFICQKRPDLMFAASLLSRFMSKPSHLHLGAAKRVLRYVMGTMEYGIRFEKNSKLEVKDYCDSEWAESVDDMKNTSGYVFNLGSCVISWCSKKQDTVAQSSAEVKYLAAEQLGMTFGWLWLTVVDPVDIVIAIKFGFGSRLCEGKVLAPLTSVLPNVNHVDNLARMSVVT
ncbi:hypothetical protein TSUD_59560 [Trifolium subterraneum]|uniref:Reverse transcriptase Ty1/copia-type domain-containing protein n=1 Tax=Trifolium subterraneum TaxID=3900 RepID=A0A2Z6MGA3_TRISU|nr:hypothetical protein TSUD_59560 [Trifolium subterraneum]